MTEGLIRYLIVGVGSNLLNFALYSIAFLLNIPLLLASGLGYSGGLFCSYHFGRTWVFEQRFAITSRNIIRFIGVYLIGGIGMVALIEVTFKKFEFDYRVSWIFGAIFALVNNFLGLKFFVFNRAKNGK